MTTDDHDPTQAGFTLLAVGPIRLSGNEVQALCLKAARGAGLSWGLAEEAGYAARWLYERGLDGPTALTRSLTANEGTTAVVILEDRVFRDRSGGALCPISAGAGMSDFAAVSTGPWAAKAVRTPLLLLPFVAQIATGAKVSLQLKWSGGAVTVSPEGAVSGEVDSLAATPVADISVEAGPKEKPKSPNSTDCPAVPPETLDRLNAYALRTTVPPSDASRSDAGAAGGDND